MPMNTPAKASLTLVASVALIVGCRGKRVSPDRGIADRDNGMGLVLSQEQGSQLSHDTAIGMANVTRDEFGLLHVTQPLRSAVQYTLYLEYRYSFFDGAGKQIEGPMGWTPITLEAGSPGTIQFASTAKNAANYQLNLRYQR